jgi:hypothetical protein
MGDMQVPRSFRQAGGVAVLVVTVAALSVPPPSAGAAEADCQRPPSGSLVFGCVWTGPNYSGTMTRYDSRTSPSTGCLEGSPRSAVNNTPGTSKTRYAFSFYSHPGCEKGGKAFGVLGPGQTDPDLPGVQSYSWTKYSG